MDRLHPSSPGSAPRIAGLRKLSRHIHEHRRLREIAPRESTDIPIVATPEELEAIRSQLGTSEQMLAELFAPAYDRGPESMLARAQAAAIIEFNFDQIVEDWC